MPDQDQTQNDACGSGTLDYSTPEAEAAFRALAPIIDQLRAELARPVDKRVRLYERTLGLAVIPVLLRRGVILLARKISGRQG